MIMALKRWEGKGGVKGDREGRDRKRAGASLLPNKNRESEQEWKM